MVVGSQEVRHWVIGAARCRLDGRRHVDRGLALARDDVSEGSQDVEASGGLRVSLSAVLRDGDGVRDACLVGIVVVERSELVGKDDEAGSKEEITGACQLGEVLGIEEALAMGQAHLLDKWVTLRQVVVHKGLLD